MSKNIKRTNIYNDMQQKFDKKKGRAAGKSPANQDLVYQHMSNHYRKILNAKKTVDTSPPYSYTARKSSSSLKKTFSPTKSSSISKTLLSKNTSPVLTDRSNSSNSCKGSSWCADSVLCSSSRFHAACIPENAVCLPVKVTCVDMSLIDKITYDTKNGPSAYCDQGWREIKAQHNDRRYLHSSTDVLIPASPSCSASKPKRRLSLKTSETSQRRKFFAKSQSAVPCNALNKPKPTSKAAKPESASKLRNLRVYNPPRSVVVEEPEDEDIQINPNCDCDTDSSISECSCSDDNASSKKLSTETPKENQTSSRDSAYNGGISSLPESRSPTPDQANKTETVVDQDKNRCYEIVEEEQVDNCSKASTVSETNKPYALEWTKPNASKHKNFLLHKEESENLRKMKEESLYVKFIQDITVEILEKSLYTNKAIKKVMKRHLLQNLSILDKERMLKDLENLRIQIGIPEDDSLFDLSVGVKDSPTDLSNTFPMISDSEFVVPKDVKHVQNVSITTKTNFFSRNTSLDNKWPRSISQVLENNESVCNTDSRDEEEDEDLISVIQVSKALREKRKEMYGGKKGNLMEVGDLGLGLKKKTKKPHFKKEVDMKIFDSSSISSSEAEEKEEVTKTLKDIPEYEDSSSRDDSWCRKSKKKVPILEKKPRVVSFGRSIEEPAVFDLKIREVIKPLKKFNS